MYTPPLLGEHFNKPLPALSLSPVYLLAGNAPFAAGRGGGDEYAPFMKEQKFRGGRLYPVAGLPVRAPNWGWEKIITILQINGNGFIFSHPFLSRGGGGV